jgi:hypothetical protein
MEKTKKVKIAAAVGIVVIGGGIALRANYNRNKANTEFVAPTLSEKNYTIMGMPPYKTTSTECLEEIFEMEKQYENVQKLAKKDHAEAESLLGIFTLGFNVNKARAELSDQINLLRKKVSTTTNICNPDPSTTDYSFELKEK